MRVCKCGGTVDTYELVGGRVRWVCRACKRVETIPSQPVVKY